MDKAILTQGRKCACEGRGFTEPLQTFYPAGRNCLVYTLWRLIIFLAHCLQQQNKYTQTFFENIYVNECQTYELINPLHKK